MDASSTALPLTLRCDGEQHRKAGVQLQLQLQLEEKKKAKRETQKEVRAPHRLRLYLNLFLASHFSSTFGSITARAVLLSSARKKWHPHGVIPTTPPRRSSPERVTLPPQCTSLQRW